jgi:hypothetical protein
MIAICPSCHDQVHRSDLGIDDETLYRWKQLVREPVQTDHVYVEPGEESKLLLGSIAFTGDGTGVRVFELRPNSRVSFDLIDGRLMNLNLNVATPSGDELLRVVDGHITHQVDDRLSYKRRTGRCRLEAPISDDFIPMWALERLAGVGQLQGFVTGVERGSAALVPPVWVRGPREHDDVLVRQIHLAALALRRRPHHVAAAVLPVPHEIALREVRLRLAEVLVDQRQQLHLRAQHDRHQNRLYSEPRG